MKKFANLKKYYLKEARKIKSLTSGQAGIGFLPRWEHFEKLAFLDDYVMPLTSISSLETESTSPTQSAQVSLFIEFIFIFYHIVVYVVIEIHLH